MSVQGTFALDFSPNGNDGSHCAIHTLTHVIPMTSRVQLQAGKVRDAGGSGAQGVSLCEAHLPTGGVATPALASHSPLRPPALTGLDDKDFGEIPAELLGR